MKQKDKEVMKDYIDNFLNNYATIPFNLYMMIIKNFSNDYDLKEMTKMVNIVNTDIDSAKSILSNKNVQTFVNIIHKYRHKDIRYSWSLISECYENFSQTTIKKYAKHLNWNIISSREPSEEFIGKNLKYIVWNELPCSDKSIGFFDKYADKINWDKVKWALLDSDIIEKYKHKMATIKFKTNEKEDGVIYGKCSNEFLEQYKDLIPKMTEEEIIIKSMKNEPSNWDHISLFYELTEDFMDYLEHRVNWDIISYSQRMSLDFLLKYKDRIKVDFLKENPKISQEIKDEFLKNI